MLESSCVTMGRALDAHRLAAAQAGTLAAPAHEHKKSTGLLMSCAHQLTGVVTGVGSRQVGFCQHTCQCLH